MRRRRRYFPYQANQTISRESSQPHCHGSLPTLQGVCDLTDRVHDHAYRRIQLFYYLLLAYWKEGATIQIERTISQHGTSSCAHCSAAHSSILPNVADDKEVLSRESYLWHAMNSTVEMPHEVNQFDTVIEKVMRSKAIEHLQDVSKNGVHPYAALQSFVDKMQQFFEDSRRHIRSKIFLLYQIQTIENKINGMELRGKSDGKYLNALKRLKTLRREYHKPSECAYIVKLRNYPPERLLMLRQAHENCPQKLTNLVGSVHPFDLKEYRLIQRKFLKSLTILELQAEATALPLFEVLSGKMVKGRLTPLSDEELIEQKRNLLQAKV